jgi:hypothetical protein
MKPQPHSAIGLAEQHPLVNIKQSSQITKDLSPTGIRMGSLGAEDQSHGSSTHLQQKFFMPAIQTSQFADARKYSDYTPANPFKLDLNQVVVGNVSQKNPSSKQGSTKLSDLRKSKKHKKLPFEQPEVDEMRFDDIDDDSDLE